MSEIPKRPLNIVCLATYFKGADFIRECKDQGCQRDPDHQGEDAE